MDPHDLLQAALRLPPKARAALAGSLLQSLEERVDQDAEGAWSTEIEKRLREIDQRQVTMVPWDEVRRRIGRSLMLTLLACLAPLAGCTSVAQLDRESLYFEVVLSIRATFEQPIPVPRETPFDSDATARASYDKCFTAGYRSAMIGYLSSFCEQPPSEPRWRGWNDGQNAGMTALYEGCERWTTQGSAEPGSAERWKVEPFPVPGAKQ